MFLALAVLTTGCIRKFAISKLGDALAQSGTTFASDGDPDLIQAAVPFGLKPIESLLAESPRHRGLEVRYRDFGKALRAGPAGYWSGPISFSWSSECTNWHHSYF